MTEEEFKTRIKEPYRMHNSINYLYAIGFIAMGVYYLGVVLHDRLVVNGNYEALLIPLCPMLLGCYCLWRIPKDYEVISIQTSKNESEKWQIINDYIHTLKKVKTNKTGKFLECTYQVWYTKRAVIYVFIDGKNLFLNLHTIWRYNDTFGGIDWGRTQTQWLTLKDNLNGKL
jgi:hypothetical protein